MPAIAYNNHPLEECLYQANQLVAKGGTVFQKFTCSNCMTRQTMPDANVFYTHGKCEECGHLTDIRKDGCNFLAVLTGDERIVNYLDSLVEQSEEDQEYKVHHFHPGEQK